MTEVGGDAAFYIPAKPAHGAQAWAEQAAARVVEILQVTLDETSSRRQLGYRQVAQFDAEQTLNAYERIYRQALGKTRA